MINGEATAPKKEHDSKIKALKKDIKMPDERGRRMRSHPQGVPHS